MDSTLAYIIGLFLLTLFSFKFFPKRNRTKQRSAKLPPGSMGWPYIGQTLQLYSQDPNTFFFSKQKRLICYLYIQFHSISMCLLSFSWIQILCICCSHCRVIKFMKDKIFKFFILIFNNSAVATSVHAKNQIEYLQQSFWCRPQLQMIWELNTMVLIILNF